MRAECFYVGRLTAQSLHPLKRPRLSPNELRMQVHLLCHCATAIRSIFCLTRSADIRIKEVIDHLSWRQFPRISGHRHEPWNEQECLR